MCAALEKLEKSEFDFLTVKKKTHYLTDPSTACTVCAVVPA